MKDLENPENRSIKEYSEELKAIKEELALEYKEKVKRDAELVIINIELAYQNAENAKKEAELMIANKELIFQNEEKGKRAAELIIANIELAYQNQEKAKRAAELIIANKEHAFERIEKEKRANELISANTELIFQNEEKEKRAAELIIANSELIFQNEEKEKRAAELALANTELAFQNEEKEKRAFEIDLLNKELEQFAYIASHDLQQPLRTVSNYMNLFQEKYLSQLDENAGKHIASVNNAVNRMSLLINSLLIFSQLGQDRKLTNISIKSVLDGIINDHDALIKSTNTVIEIEAMPTLNIYETEMYQLFQNLITNAIKFQKAGSQPKIKIWAEEKKDKWQFAVSDNGIGIDAVHYEKIFDIFQRLHEKKAYEGSGIGLANCKKIIQLHRGEIWLKSKLNEGTIFYFTIPNVTL
ncbi:MAG: GHKL domain-containing protein [Bacteroidetes bacterium]|nr:GHKL domain-containing protein [Bacteroidota bacterium]